MIFERRPHRTTWVGLAFAVLALLMIPWTIHLAIALPNRSVVRHYDVAWAGFDIALASALAWTAYCTVRRTHWLPIAASVNATLLVVDAWFDVLTASSGRNLLIALGSALLIELPLAGVLLWIAVTGWQMVRRGQPPAVEPSDEEQRRG